MPGDFSKYLTKRAAGGNGQDRGIPIGSTRYDMAEISFYMQATPKEVLSSVLQQTVHALQQNGQFGEANALIKNPQPFVGNPQAMAVFMAASLEIEQLRERIGLLAGALGNLAEALIQDPDVPAGTLRDAALSTLEVAKAQAQEEGGR